MNQKPKQLIYLGSGLDIVPLFYSFSNYSHKFSKKKKIIKILKEVETFIYVDMEPYEEYDVWDKDSLNLLTFDQKNQYIFKLLDKLGLDKTFIHKTVMPENKNYFELHFINHKILKYYCGTKLFKIFENEINYNPSLLNDIRTSDIFYVMGFFFDETFEDVQSLQKLCSFLSSCTKIIVQNSLYKYRSKMFQILIGCLHQKTIIYRMKYQNQISKKYLKNCDSRIRLSL
jgi:hypothetical protein